MSFLDSIQELGDEEVEPAEARAVLSAWCDRMGLSGCSVGRRVTTGRKTPEEVVRDLHAGLHELESTDAASVGPDGELPELPERILAEVVAGLVPERAVRSIFDRYLCSIRELDEVYDRLTRALGCQSRPLNPDVLVDKVEGVVSAALTEERRIGKVRQRRQNRHLASQGSAGDAA